MMNYHELLHTPLVPSRVVKLIESAQHNQAPVFIQGERGTGKELIAKIIHYTSDPPYRRFHRIDCRLLVEETWRDQLTPILRDSCRVESPVTLYLKEVGLLQASIQRKLLEWIEDGIIENEKDQGNFKKIRLISSSSDNVRALVIQRRFSEDLYDRLNTLFISIPALRERVKEIPIIAQHLLLENAEKLKIRRVGLSDQALRALEAYGWPGNLKEFEQVIIRSAIFSEGEILGEGDLFLNIDHEMNSNAGFFNKEERPSFPRSSRNPTEAPPTPPLPLFFIELVHRIKNPLVSIKTFTQLLREKFGDEEFREYFYKIVTEDIEKIDSVMNGLLNYIKINTPIDKTNTVHLILEEILKKMAPQIQQKRITVIKKLEQDLPETIVHDEQLRYILHAILEYAMPAIPPEGSIAVLTKSSRRLHKQGPDKQTHPSDPERYVDIFVLFTGYKRSSDPFEVTLGLARSQQEESIELELRLVREIIRKNRGVMKFQVNEKKPRTLICLRFPVERRKVVTYSPVKES
jgi:hypothetical protein